jgi:multidrug efflux pump subunit AcrA (membrane-fusion protein)
MKKHPRAITRGIRAAVLAAALIAAVSCGPGSREAADRAGATPTAERLKSPVNVRTAEAVAGDVEERIVFGGDVYATGRVNVVPDTAGVLTRILVQPGDRVVFDQIVAYVDPSRPGMSYSESPVRSKSAGTVTDIPAVSGNRVTTQSVIAEMGRIDRLEIEIRVPEKYLSVLDAGLSARVKSRAYPTETISARVSEVAPVVDPRSRTVAVTLEPEPTDLLRPGQSVQVELVLGVHTNAVLVPAVAITERLGGEGVFVVRDGRSEWRAVTAGLNDGGMVEVLDGLGTGEAVVVEGNRDITDRSPVRVMEG